MKELTMALQPFFPREIPSLPDDDAAFDAADVRERRADSIRRHLDMADVIAETLHLLLEADLTDNPLRHLVAHCIRYGTETETYKLPPMSASVGHALEPFILQAITRLVDAQMLIEDD
jgi:hypothetical protein